jgi:hypothetical protein
MRVGEAAAQFFCFFAGWRLKQLAVGMEGHQLEGALGARRHFLKILACF